MCPLATGGIRLLVLEAAYEATMWSAVLNARRGASKVVLLTLLGGGAFGNERGVDSRRLAPGARTGLVVRPRREDRELRRAVAGGSCHRQGFRAFKVVLVRRPYRQGIHPDAVQVGCEEGKRLYLKRLGIGERSFLLRSPASFGRPPGLPRRPTQPALLGQRGFR